MRAVGADVVLVKLGLFVVAGLRGVKRLGCTVIL